MGSEVGTAVGTATGTIEGGDVPVGGDVGTPVGGTLGAGDGSAVGTAVGTGVGQGVCTKRQQASTPLAGSTPPSQGPSNLWLAPSALVMASGPSLPEPVTAVTAPVVVGSPSSQTWRGAPRRRRRRRC